MWFLIGIQLFVILLLFLLGWAIRKNEAYWLISGFAARSEEEQQQLIKNGYPQKTGELLIATAVGMIILLPLIFTPFKYAMEVQFGFMLVFLLGGFIYLSKYEVPEKRKRSYIIGSVLFVVVNGFISVMLFLGYQDYELIAKKDTFEITGIYGDEWEYEDIKRIELMEEMPEVTWKQDGYGLSTLAKGNFTVEGYGSCLLFIRKDSSPYLYIELENKKIFINGRCSNEARGWYEQLIQKVESTK
ncbi:hypothetical protein C0966_16910 [Bacillus methanolicus]|uniref:DUF3784 domain-containing protein n=1 Tax=Bacillus methanolicus TaxID=1471 RepID=UPI00237FF621|nr:DUF3784 domain-containing protein [Bacillus methanolicus]MDE3840948.1 hypothetical protein [Bacillus methanolicus]